MMYLLQLATVLALFVALIGGSVASTHPPHHSLEVHRTLQQGPSSLPTMAPTLAPTMEQVVVANTNAPTSKPTIESMTDITIANIYSTFTYWWVIFVMTLLATIFIANPFHDMILWFLCLRFRVSGFYYDSHLTNTIFESIPGLKEIISSRLTYSDCILNSHSPPTCWEGNAQFKPPSDFKDVCKIVITRGYYFLETRSSILLFIKNSENTQPSYFSLKPAADMMNWYKEILERGVQCFCGRGPRQLRVVLCTSRDHFSAALSFYTIDTDGTLTKAKVESSKGLSIWFCPIALSSCCRTSCVVNTKDSIVVACIRSKIPTIFFADHNEVFDPPSHKVPETSILNAIRNTGFGYRRTLSSLVHLFGVTKYNNIVRDGIEFSQLVLLLNYFASSYDCFFQVEYIHEKPTSYSTPMSKTHPSPSSCSSLNSTVVGASSIKTAPSSENSNRPGNLIGELSDVICVGYGSRGHFLRIFQDQKRIRCYAMFNNNPNTFQFGKVNPQTNLPIFKDPFSIELPDQRKAALQEIETAEENVQFRGDNVESLQKVLDEQYREEN